MNSCSYVYLNGDTHDNANIESDAIGYHAARCLKTAPPTAPAAATARRNGCLFDTMPDDELLYDLADLFKVFADTTRIKILLRPHGKRPLRRRHRRHHRSHAKRRLPSAARSQTGATREVPARRQNVIYSLSDNHVYTVLAQGMTHICE